MDDLLAISGAILLALLLYRIIFGGKGGSKSNDYLKLLTDDKYKVKGQWDK